MATAAPTSQAYAAPWLLDARSPAVDSGSAVAPWANFPEHWFPPARNEAARYHERVARGYETARGRRTVFSLLARDVAASLPATVQHLERLGDLFGDYRVVVYENDSLDGTLGLLRRWAERNARVEVISEVRAAPREMPVRCPRRGDRMAWCRNRCHDRVARNFADFDYSVVVDADLAGGWSAEGLAHTLGGQEWDFVGSNGIILRRQGWNPNVCLQYDAWAFRQDEKFAALPCKAVNRLEWQRGTPLLPVTSCFGGLGIYRMPAFLAARYAGGDCEHVALHRGLREKGYRRLFLNPSQIALYGRKVRKWDGLLERLYRGASWAGITAVPVWRFSA